MGRPIGRPPSCTCGECKKCKWAAYMREWWRSKPIEHRRRLVAGRDPEKVREQDRKKMAKRRRERPDQAVKARAHRLVRAAVERGELERGPCEVCGTTEDIQGHHDDHSKPLEVRWLCGHHHREHHTQGMGLAA